jgi:hypothetical protein
MRCPRWSLAGDEPSPDMTVRFTVGIERCPERNVAFKWFSAG